MTRRLAGVGLGWLFAVAPAYAQSPSGVSSSPVRVRGVRTADAPSLTARAQADPTMPPLPPLPDIGARPQAMPMQPMPMGNPMPMGSPMPLGAPRPLGGPTITAENEPNGPMSARPGAGTVPGMGPTYLGPPGSGGYPMTAPPTAGYPMAAPPMTGGYPMAAPSATMPYGSPGMTVPPESPHPTTAYPGMYGPTVAPAPQLDAPLFEGAYPLAPRYGGWNTLLSGPANTYGDRWQLTGEYLLWWTRSARFPVLVSTSSPQFNGILGTGDSRVVFGDRTFGQTMHGGGRFGFRRAFGDGRWSLNGSIFFLGRNGEEFRTDTSQFPLLARPFTNLNQNISFAQLVASPGLATGAVAVNFENLTWGADLDLRRRIACNACSRLDLLTGFRFLNVSEQLRITESFARTADSPPSIGVPNAMSGSVYDQFRTENRFYGGTLGLVGERTVGRWTASLSGKVSLGTVQQQAFIEGGQTIQLRDGSTRREVGGLLALPGNIGTWSQEKFAVVPEAAFNLGYQVTPHLRLFVGYSFLYLSSALRPGDQIDTGLDVTRIPNFPVDGVTRLPITRPVPTLRDTGFFAQGVSFGMLWRW